MLHGSYDSHEYPCESCVTETYLFSCGPVNFSHSVSTRTGFFLYAFVLRLQIFVTRYSSLILVFDQVCFKILFVTSEVFFSKERFMTLWSLFLSEQ